MATAPTTIVANDVTTEGPSGKAAGATTRAARKGAAEGGAVGTLIAYVLVKTGLEADATTAVLVAGAIATVLATVVTHFQGKATPTDQARTERHTETRTVVAPGPQGPLGGPVTDGGVPAPAQPEIVPTDVEARDPRHRAED